VKSAINQIIREEIHADKFKPIEEEYEKKVAEITEGLYSGQK